MISMYRKGAPLSTKKWRDGSRSVPNRHDRERPFDHHCVEMASAVPMKIFLPCALVNLLLSGFLPRFGTGLLDVSQDKLEDGRPLRGMPVRMPGVFMPGEGEVADLSWGTGLFHA